MASFGRPTVEAAIKRIKKALNIRTDRELADKLEMTRSGLGSWKTRGSLDIALIQEKVKGISIDWILRGVGEPFLYDNANIDLKEPVRRVLEDNAEYIANALKTPDLLNSSKKNISNLEKEIKQSHTIPVFNSVSAGNPEVAFNELKGYYRYDYLINERTIGLDMNTDKYSEYGINKGDTCIVDTAREPVDGNIVLVKKEENFELLYYYNKENIIYYEEVTKNSERIRYEVDSLIDVVGVIIAKIRNM